MSGGFDGLNIFGSILSRTNKRVGFAIVDTNKDKVVDENEFQNVKAMYKVDQLDFATIDTNRDGEISQTEWARIQVGMDLQNILNNLSGRISSTYSDIDKICQPFVADKLAEAARAFDIDQPNVQEVFTQYMNQLFDQIYEGLSSTAGLDGCRRPGAARDEAQKDFLASLNIYEQGERPEGTTPSYSATCENMIKKAVQAKVKEWTDSHPDEWNTMDIDALEQAKANLRACLEEFMTTEKIQEFENLAKASDINYCQTTVQNYDALNTDYNTNASSLNSQLGELETQVKDLLAVLPSNSQDATTQRAIDGLKNLKKALTKNGQILTSVGNLLNNDDCSRDIAAIKEGLEDTNIGSLAAGDLKAKAEKWFSEITKDQTGLANVKSSMSTLAATFAAIQEGINRKKEPVIIGVDLTNPDTEPVTIDVIYNPNINQNPTGTAHIDAITAKVSLYHVKDQGYWTSACGAYNNFKATYKQQFINAAKDDGYNQAYAEKAFSTLCSYYYTAFESIRHTTTLTSWDNDDTFDHTTINTTFVFKDELTGEYMTASDVATSVRSQKDGTTKDANGNTVEIWKTYENNNTTAHHVSNSGTGLYIACLWSGGSNSYSIGLDLGIAAQRFKQFLH